MRKKKQVLNYHSKNGIIMARDSGMKRYSRIQPWFTEDEIRLHLEMQHTKTAKHTVTSCIRRLADIPNGSVARKTADLEEFVVPPTRKTRQSRRGEDASGNC